jgi:adenylate kinase family enzyme
MKHQLLFIEGLPGSGKTTYANKLKKYYESKGFRVVQFSEGDLHPIDLAWCSIMDKEQFEHILKKYPVLKDEILRLTKKENDQFITAYTRVRHEEVRQAFYDEMKTYEIYRAKDLNTFLEEHLKRYEYFSKHYDQNTLYIFECIFLQNHITELILNYNQDKEQIIEYFQKLIKPLKNLNPMMFYIYQNDIKHIFNKTIEERRTDQPEKYRDWIDEVIIYLESTNFAKSLNFLGKDGMLRYGKYRQDLEQKVMKKINIDYKVFELDHDYDKVFEKMMKVDL